MSKKMAIDIIDSYNHQVKHSLSRYPCITLPLYKLMWTYTRVVSFRVKKVHCSSVLKFYFYFRVLPLKRSKISTDLLMQTGLMHTTDGNIG